jgi:hypothetical protein
VRTHNRRRSWSIGDLLCLPSVFFFMSALFFTTSSCVLLAPPPALCLQSPYLAPHARAADGDAAGASLPFTAVAGAAVTPQVFN